MEDFETERVRIIGNGVYIFVIIIASVIAIGWLGLSAAAVWMAFHG